MPDWISVKDRLPEETGDVLVHSKSGLNYVVNYSEKHKKFNVEDYSEDIGTAMNVTHWMPLPDPPKEVNSP